MEKRIKANSTSEPQKRANRKYEVEKTDNIRVRVPKGSANIIKDYVADSSKYNSVNGMIIELIEKEIGKKLK
jgi:hypothetical protein